MKWFLRVFVMLLCLAIVWMTSAPALAGGGLFKRLRPRAAATQKTVSIQKSVATSNGVSGGCRMVNGRLVCPRQ